jgi:uncharacterized protein YybS (DUF2232 family)
VHHRSSGVKGLVFGSLMAALIVVFALVPVLSLLMPVPLVLAYVRFGGRAAGLTAVVAALFSAMFVGPLQAFFLLIPAGILPGLAFGYGFRHKLKPLVIGLLAVAVFIGGWAAEYVLMRALVLDGRDPIATALESEQGRQALVRMTDFMEGLQAGQPAETAQQKRAIEMTKTWASEIQANPVQVTWMLLPSVLFLLGTLSAWINYMLCRMILPRFGHEVPAPAPFAAFRLPVWLTLIFTTAFWGAGFIGNSLLHSPWWVQLILNVLPPLQLIFVLAGIAVAYGYLRKKEVSKGIAIAFSLSGFLMGPFGLYIYMMVAMWDSIFDFRGLGHGLIKPRPEQTP